MTKCHVYLTTSRRDESIGKSYRKFDTNFPNQTTIDWDNRETLSPLRNYDYTCVQFRDGKRLGSNFISADCAYLDFDHVIPEPNLKLWREETKKLAKQIRQDERQCSVAVIPSISLTGCHILIPFSTDVTNATVYSHVCSNLVSLCPTADNAVKDSARFSYACYADDYADYAYFVRGVTMGWKEFDHQPARPASQGGKLFTQYSDYTGNVLSGLSFNHGERNINALKLACRLLNKYPEGEAKENYLALLSQVCDLPEREIETVWKHAVDSMIGRGLAYRTPREHDDVYREEQKIEANPKRGESLSDIQVLCERFMELYFQFGLKSALKTLTDDLVKLREEGGRVPQQTINRLPALAEQWSDAYIPKQIQEALGRLNPTGKTVSELAHSLCEYIKHSRTPVMFLNETGEWKLFSIEQAKWRTCSPAEVVGEMLKGIREMRKRMAESGGTDQKLSSALKKTADSSSLIHLAQPSLTVQYADIQNSTDYLLATPQGIIDFRANYGVRPTQPSDYVLRTTKASLPTRRTENGLWERTLHQIIPDQKEYEWFRMVIGSQLKRDGMYFWYGDGANGKSTIFDTLAYVLGDYAGTIAPEVLGRRLSNREYEYGRAKLMDKRFVLCQEAGPDMMLDPSQMKQVATAHDIVSGSLKYRNTFDFLPTHTLNFIANQLPAIYNTKDKAVRRRILGVYKFKQSFANHPDPDLNHRLIEECADEVLQWAVNATLDYVHNGEKIPYLPIVHEEADQYIEEQNYFAKFLEDCFTPNTLYATPASAVDYIYQVWAKNIGHHAEHLSMIAIGKAMHEEGYDSTRTRIDGKQLRVYEGLKLDESSLAWKIITEKEFRGNEPFRSYMIH